MTADLVSATEGLSLNKQGASPPITSPAAGSASPTPPTLAPRATAPPSALPTSGGPLTGSNAAARPPQGMGARRAGMGMNLNGAGGPSPRGPVLGGGGAAPMPPGLAAKLNASRAGAGPSLRGPINSNGPVPPSLMSRPGAGAGAASAPPMTMGGLAARRAQAAAQAANGGGAGGGGPSMSRPGPGGMGGALPTGSGLPGMGARRMPPGRLPPGGGGGMNLSSMGGMGGPATDAFSNFNRIVDPSGKLNFSSKAVLHADGVDFSSGQSYKINMQELELEEELGKGQYGTVQRVFHKPTKVVMAMKEIHLELDQSKLNGILMELDILHRAVAPEIVEFYGAFFIESCVYYCMEYMDAGSLDKVYEGGVTDENVLARITGSMVRGLGFLKDTLQIMHRDVKPTNVLVNKKGQVKLCDFGVSGQLEKSLAKTNIGCETYMAPERITGEYANNLGTYSVSSDVWSLGLSIIELAIGKYPYPPEVFSSPLAQLQAIVHGEPPTLPETFSAEARDFVAQCLKKSPTERPTYSELLKHPFLVADAGREVDMATWVTESLARRAAKGVPLAPMTPSNPAAATA